MAKQRRNRRQVAHPGRRLLISSFSILILSGFLIGSAANAFVAGDLRGYLMVAGIIGILSFLGLDLVETLRYQRAEIADQRYVEDRLDRHIDRSTAGFDGEFNEEFDDIDEVEVSVEEFQPVS